MDASETDCFIVGTETVNEEDDNDPFSRVKDCCQSAFDSDLIFYATLPFAAVMYVVDIGSDVRLAIRYFLDGHNWWEFGPPPDSFWCHLQNSP